MTDDNKELIARLARRGEELPDPLATQPMAVVSGHDWNVPIDMTMADSKTETEVIKGMVSRAKEYARAWTPAPMPADWIG